MLRVPKVNLGSFFKASRPEPIVVVHTENGPKMMTLEAARKQIGDDDQNNKSPKFLEWLRNFFRRFLNLS